MLEIPARKEKKYVCIVLHGLGASSRDLYPLAPSIWPNDEVHWLFLDAPVKPITINAGLQMPAWYDVKNIDLLIDQDENGIKDSYQIIKSVIDAEIAKGIASKNIAIIGFSQGGVMALYTALHLPEPLLASVALSGYLPLADNLPEVVNNKTPIFLGAGQFDIVISAESTRKADEILRNLGFSSKFKIYPNLAHGINPEEVSDVANFLSGLI